MRLTIDRMWYNILPMNLFILRKDNKGNTGSYPHFIHRFSTIFFHNNKDKKLIDNKGKNNYNKKGNKDNLPGGEK